MAGQRGRDVLISIGDGGEPEMFAVVAGIRARTISLTAGLVEATTAQSAQAWRELIAEAATKRAEVAGSGVFRDAASDARLRTAYFNGEPPLAGPERYQVRISATGVAREWAVDEPAAIYAEADRLADFPAGGDAVVEVAQLGLDGQAGSPATLQMAIPAP